MAWSSYAESAALTLDQDNEFFTDGTDAIVLALNPREIANLVFQCDFDGSGTDEVQIRILAGHRVSTGNGLDGTTSTTDYELDTAADGFSSDDELNGYWLIMTSGDEQGEGRMIVDSVAADDGVVFTHAFSAQSSAAETYDLYRFDVVAELIIDLADPAENVTNTASLQIQGYPYVAAVAMMSGATDTPAVRMSYQTDGVSA